MIGKTLSHYKVLEKIGQGGMGEVYRAEDTSLKRDVAIKVLPEQFTKDPQRLARFEREAQLLAQLNHPNIAAIYGFEEADDVRFLAMELVPGETLAERVAKGPVPVEETLEICRQIAEGVEAAHEKGVIHRDLKPANVKVTPEGKIKILDFGLAKAFEDEMPAADISQSPTLTEEMTRAGVILGTAAYMSPEQAKGKEVNKQADIFSFGTILYELLTGKRAFQGETITETLAKILEGEPDWKIVPQSVPTRIQELIEDCLEKAPDKRLRDIGNARIQIKRALKEPASPTDVASAVQPVQQRWALAVGLVLGAVVAGLAVWLLIQPSSPEQRLNEFIITPPPTAPMQRSFRNELAISPEGRHIVYTGASQNQSQFYLRSLDDVIVTPISGTEGGQHPFFSPDGQSLAFFAAGELKKVPLAGGSAITLCDASGSGTTGSWGSGDTIVFSAASETATDLYQVSAAGGERRSIASPNLDNDEDGYYSPQILPGGKAILFWIGRGPGDPSQIAVLSLETGEQKILIEAGRQARYLPTGHLIYEQAATGNLMAVAFDLATLEITSDPVPVLQGVRQVVPGYVDYAVSDEGTLVHVPDLGASGYSLAWVDREGRETLVTQEKREYATPRLSPDGRRVIFSMRQTGPSDSVTIYDLERDSFSRLTVDGTRVGSAIWTPDGKWITFQAIINGPRNIYRQLADRSALPEQLTTLADELSKQPTSWSPDGRVLTFNLADQNSNAWDIVILNKEENEEPQPFIASPNHECCARFSPDGKWLAYVSDELGRNQVYVRPYPGPDIKFLVSEEREGGGEPVWSPDGSELFYRSGDRMMVVSVQTEPTFRAGRPEVLFEGSYRATVGPLGYQYYDISPDGQRFLMIRRDEAPSYINVILNWFEELKRLVPTN